MCMTWEIHPENVTLKCTVSCMQYSVTIYNPVNVEEGYCQFYHEHTECAPKTKNHKIYLDRSTNKTILIIMTHIDDKMNGPWRCDHGTNRDTAIVNITVLPKGKSNYLLNNRYLSMNYNYKQI